MANAPPMSWLLRGLFAACAVVYPEASEEADLDVGHRCVGRRRGQTKA